MLRVNNAKVCPNCDTLYDGQLCPLCLSKHGYPLREWFLPMNHLFFGGEYDECKTCPDTVQKKPSKLRSNSFVHDAIPYSLADKHNSIDKRNRRLDAERPDESHSCKEPIGPISCNGHNYNGKSLENQCDIKCGSLGSHASDARMDSKTESFRNPFQEGPVEPRKKYFGWMSRIKGSFIGIFKFVTKGTRGIFRQGERVY